MIRGILYDSVHEVRQMLVEVGAVRVSFMQKCTSGGEQQNSVGIFITLMELTAPAPALELKNSCGAAACLRFNKKKARRERHVLLLGEAITYNEAVTQETKADRVLCF